MEERRKAERLKKENEITINIVSEDTFIPKEEWSKIQEINKKEDNSSKEKIPYNCSTDISVSGAKIQSNILLPVDTILKIDITLKNLQQKITTIGKVKWNKIIIADESYEAGVEFIDTPDEAIQKLYERMQKEEEWSKIQEINKYEISQEEDAFIPEEEWSKLHEINKKEEVFIDKQIKMTTEDDMNKCRYCSREIKSDAIKCEYCGRTLNQRTAKKIFI